MYMPFRAFDHSGQRPFWCKEPKQEEGSSFLILMIWLETNSCYCNHSYQTVIKENTFGSITLKLGTKERWIVEGKKWSYLMHG